jgi:hypothetical protein
LPEKAIFWEEQQTLIVADIHLGNLDISERRNTANAYPSLLPIWFTTSYFACFREIYCKV